MPEQFFIKELPNGIILLGQRMEQVSSAAMSLLLPAGASLDDDLSAGAATVAGEWCLRGAGDRDTRRLNDALDCLGCQHHQNVLSRHIHFSAAQLGRNLTDVLTIHADIIRRPMLREETFEPCRSLVLQELEALEDEPAQKCNVLLREQFYPYPLGRCTGGHAEALHKMTSGAVREHIQGHFTPQGFLLAAAGNIEWDRFCDTAEKCFGDWKAAPAAATKPAPARKGFTHIKKESAQVHIAIGHASVPLSDGRYYAARMAETVLSGGMSGRLFTEVREKRGLVYHVSSRYHSLKDYAGMFTYAGTTPEKAQQTFDVTVGELRRLGEGVGDDEMDRARTQLKSSLIMQGESTSARAGALAGDWYHLRRLRSLKEISDAIDNVKSDDVLEYLRDFPADDLTVLIIGPQPINVGGTD